MKPLLLPDFCAARAVLMVLVIAGVRSFVAGLVMAVGALVLFALGLATHLHPQGAGAARSGRRPPPAR